MVELSRELQDAVSRIEKENFIRRHTPRIPDELKDRHASSLSPQELDAFERAIGGGGRHWAEVGRAQARWAKDSKAVAAREADIERVKLLHAGQGERS